MFSEPEGENVRRAIEWDHAETLKALMENKHADTKFRWVHSRGATWVTPLYWAAWLNSPGCVAVLLALGADPNWIIRGTSNWQEEGTSVIGITTRNPSFAKVVDLLLADPRTKRTLRADEWDPILLWQNHKLEVIRYLLHRGVEPEDLEDPCLDQRVEIRCRLIRARTAACRSACVVLIARLRGVAQKCMRAHLVRHFVWTTRRLAVWTPPGMTLPPGFE